MCKNSIDIANCLTWVWSSAREVHLELALAKLIMDRIGASNAQWPPWRKRSLGVINGDVVWRVEAVVGSDTDSVALEGQGGVVVVVHLQERN